MMKSSPPNWIATYHKPKGFVNPLALASEDIYIEDIQHALSNICRFNGHCREFYSVAQHSVHVSEWLARNGGSLEEQFLGLLHDASEAYLGDMVRPIKTVFDDFTWYEVGIIRLILQKFGREVSASQMIQDYHWWTNQTYRQNVKIADNDILISEALQLFDIEELGDWGFTAPHDYFHIKPVSPRDAKLLFEQKFHELSSALKEGR